MGGTNTASFLALNQVVALDPKYKWPFTYQLNFGFSQQFGRGFAVSANYVASLSRRQPLYHDINGAQINITAAGTSGASCTDLTKACGYANTSGTVNNRRRLNSLYGLSAASPVYSNVYLLTTTDSSNYNGLQGWTVSAAHYASHEAPAGTTVPGATPWPATRWTEPL